MNSPKLPDLNTLSLAEQVAQMVVVRASGYLFDHQIKYPQWEPPAAKLQHLIGNLGVGGVILLGGSGAELALRSQQLQNWAKIPLLVAADIEEGVGQRFSGATWFPPPMALSAIAQKDLSLAQQYAEKMGAVTASEALAIGINWLLAPIVDVNNNPDNPVINIRAFGETPHLVSQLTSAFIRGAQNYPVLTTAKHFPGHGDTAVDSHLELPVIPHSSGRLAEIELLPFISAISAGLDAVMTAHLSIPSWDDKLPATLSPSILTGRLRENLGFTGLIVTDALVMGAITKDYGANEAAVLAVEAGADILLMPVDAEGAIQAVCDAVNSGRISPHRIRASLERIWQAKSKVFASPNKQSEGVGENSLPRFYQLARPEALTAAADILQESTEVFGQVPLQIENLSNLRNLIVVDSLLDCKFLDRVSPAVAIPQQLGYSLQLSDLHTPMPKGSDRLQPTLLQLFIRGNPFRGSAGLNQIAREWFEKLLATDELQALVLYGSPYMKQPFLEVLPPSIPCVYSYGQIPESQRIALKLLFNM
ncbi:MAG TPA: glycoside hydrolase family 3 N-terminal domain-containing protein [Leptolyngbyaceae cyanobacterium]